jgi:hypothetical protein
VGYSFAPSNLPSADPIPTETTQPHSLQQVLTTITHLFNQANSTSTDVVPFDGERVPYGPYYTPLCYSRDQPFENSTFNLEQIVMVIAFGLLAAGLIWSVHASHKHYLQNYSFTPIQPAPQKMLEPTPFKSEELAKKTDIPKKIDDAPSPSPEKPKTLLSRVADAIRSIWKHCLDRLRALFNLRA